MSGIGATQAQLFAFKFCYYGLPLLYIISHDLVSSTLEPPLWKIHNVRLPGFCHALWIVASVVQISIPMPLASFTHSCDVSTEPKVLQNPYFTIPQLSVFNFKSGVPAAQAGLSGLAFDEGRFGVFGYITKGMELLPQLQSGDIIVSSKILSGADRLVKP